MKTFSPWNLLPLTLAVSSVTLLNWRLFRRLKWAAGDVEIMPLSDLDCGPCQVSASVIFSLRQMCREPEVAYDSLFLLWLHITFATAGNGVMTVGFLVFFLPLSWGVAMLIDDKGRSLFKSPWIHLTSCLSGKGSIEGANQGCRTISLIIWQGAVTQGYVSLLLPVVLI